MGWYNFIQPLNKENRCRKVECIKKQNQVADDINIMNRSMKVAEEIYTALKEKANTVGLKIHLQIMKTFIQTRTVVADNIDLILQFSYLGVALVSNVSEDTKIHRRIIRVNQACSGLDI